MKNHKLIFFLLLTSLFFACQKEETIIEPSTEVEVTYRLLIRGDVQLDEVRFMDENFQLQLIKNPTPDWNHKMTVEQGFVAKMELLGTLAEGYSNSAMTLINGVGYGSWGANFLHQVPGDFHIKSEYQMGGD